MPDGILLLGTELPRQTSPFSRSFRPLWLSWTMSWSITIIPAWIWITLRHPIKLLVISIRWGTQISATFIIECRVSTVPRGLPPFGRRCPSSGCSCPRRKLSASLLPYRHLPGDSGLSERRRSAPPRAGRDKRYDRARALKAFQAFGLRVPEDISIIGFDNIQFSSVSFPSLTPLPSPAGIWVLGQSACYMSKFSPQEIPPSKFASACRLSSGRAS